MKQLTKIELEKIKFSLRRIKVMAALLQNKELVEDNLIDVGGIVNKIRLLACSANEMLEENTSTSCSKCEPVCRPIMPKAPVANQAPKVTTVEGQMKSDEMDEIVNKYGDENLKNLYYSLKKQGKVAWIEIMIKGFK